MKWRASAGRCPRRRSRSGGRSDRARWRGARRGRRRSAPRRPAAGRSRLVAATMRKSTSCQSFSPRRLTTRSSSTRSSLTCVDSGVSSISSRKTVPPRAAISWPSYAAPRPRTRRGRSRTAPPPSARSGIAAQLIGTKAGRCAPTRRAAARAITSLPVPVSPVSSTGIEVARDARRPGAASRARAGLCGDDARACRAAAAPAPSSSSSRAIEQSRRRRARAATTRRRRRAATASRARAGVIAPRDTQTQRPAAPDAAARGGVAAVAVADHERARRAPLARARRRPPRRRRRSDRRVEAGPVTPA